MIRRVSEMVSVAPQIAPEDIPALKDAGFVAVVNNRPDREEPGQPSGEAVRAAAEAAGLRYAEVPVASGFSHEQVDAMAAVLAEAGGPVLAFCRSGTRSCNLWALAEAKRGGDADALVAAAANAGYDLRAIRPVLEALAA